MSKSCSKTACSNARVESKSLTDTHALVFGVWSDKVIPQDFVLHWCRASRAFQRSHTGWAMTCAVSRMHNHNPRHVVILKTRLSSTGATMRGRCLSRWSPSGPIWIGMYGQVIPTHM